MIDYGRFGGMQRAALLQQMRGAAPPRARRQHDGRGGALPYRQRRPEWPPTQTYGDPPPLYDGGLTGGTLPQIPYDQRGTIPPADTYYDPRPTDGGGGNTVYGDPPPLYDGGGGNTGPVTPESWGWGTPNDPYGGSGVGLGAGTVPQAPYDQRGTVPPVIDDQQDEWKR